MVFSVQRDFASKHYQITRDAKHDELSRSLNPKHYCSQLINDLAASSGLHHSAQFDPMLDPAYSTVIVRV